jgi:hypothetical protein
MSATESDPPADVAAEPAHAGDVVGHVEVTVGPRFLDLFSAQLYSSPNKAFEELVANSWDAGARVVHVHVPPPKELVEPGATLWVLDDGESMDIEGLRALWAVARSAKQEISPTTNRRQIGKFGIGKLATYLLANELTYVCRATDGRIRTVSMDYRRITERPDPSQLDVPAIRLEVRDITDQNLDEALAPLDPSGKVRALVAAGLAVPEDEADYDEFHSAPDTPPALPGDGTWTLAVMRTLKPPGEALKGGVIARILRSALPLGESLRIVFNTRPLRSTKMDTPVLKRWVLGRDDLERLKSVEVVTGEETTDSEQRREHAVTAHEEPYPHLVIEGLEGRITGEVALFQDSIATGKSADIGPSHGFRVNVLGRVINESEPSFGLPPLSGSAWARTRITVRADGLNADLGVNREGLREGEPLRIMQALLRSLFNAARVEWDASRHASFPDAGEIITRSWGTVPLDPLRQIVRDGLAGIQEPPSFLHIPVDANRANVSAEFAAVVDAEPNRVIEDVAFAPLGEDAQLSLFDAQSRRVVVNRDHPFAREHGGTHEQKQAVRDAALADLLTDAYMLAAGLAIDTVDDIRTYRDESLRLIAQVNRRTGPQLAKMLEEVTADARALETILDESLAYLGFIVEPKGQSGEPEGVATAPATRRENDAQVSYTFTYDAKSSKTGKAKTGNLGTAGLRRHRERYEASHTLVVAPDYEAGALEREATDNEIAPMRSRDLARLLMLTATSGALTAEEFREVLVLRTPDAIAEKVGELETRVTQRARVSLDAFLNALETLGFERPEAVTTALIVDRMRAASGNPQQPLEIEVIALVRGLEVMCPSLIRLRSGKKQVILGVSPTKLREDIMRQLNALPAALREPAIEALHLEDQPA